MVEKWNDRTITHTTRGEITLCNIWQRDEQFVVNIETWWLFKITQLLKKHLCNPAFIVSTLVETDKSLHKWPIYFLTFPGPSNNLIWNQPATNQLMQCYDQPMESTPTESYNGASMNPFNGFHHQHQQQQQIQYISSPQPPMVLQPKSKYSETSRCMMSHMI